MAWEPGSGGLATMYRAVGSVQGQLSASSQRAAIEDSLVAVARLLGVWSRSELHDDPEMLWSISDIPFPVFNTVLRTNLTSGRADAAIEEVVERYRSRGVPLLWCTGPGTRPRDLPARLAGYGFDHQECPGMAMRLRALPEELPLPAELDVSEVVDAKTMGDWCTVLCTAFDMPAFVAECFRDLYGTVGLARELGFRHYLARLDGEPVATSSVYLGAAAGLYNIATLPWARGLGAGSAVTLAPLRDALSQGYRLAVLQSTEEASAFYGRLGFKELCRIAQYLRAV